MLLLVYIFNFVDRQILAILAAPIQAELDLSDDEIGLLGGLAFALLYSTLAVTLAILADRTSRSWVIAVRSSCGVGLPPCAGWNRISGSCCLPASGWESAKRRGRTFLCPDWRLLPQRAACLRAGDTAGGGAPSTATPSLATTTFEPADPTTTTASPWFGSARSIPARRHGISRERPATRCRIRSGWQSGSTNLVINDLGGIVGNLATAIQTRASPTSMGSLFPKWLEVVPSTPA